MAKVIKFKNNIYLYGELIERVTNEYGTYEKYSDGTLIQYGTIEFSNIDITYTYGNLFYQLPGTLYFPMSFINTDYIVKFTLLTGGVGGCSFFGRYKNRISTKVFSGASVTNVTVSIDWEVKGRWK